MFGSVMAKNDGAIAEMVMLGDFLDDGGSVVVFPVQGVHIRYS